MLLIACPFPSAACVLPLSTVSSMIINSDPPQRSSFSAADRGGTAAPPRPADGQSCPAPWGGQSASICARGLCILAHVLVCLHHCGPQTSALSFSHVPLWLYSTLVSIFLVQIAPDLAPGSSFGFLRVPLMHFPHVCVFCLGLFCFCVFLVWVLLFAFGISLLPGIAG